MKKEYLEPKSKICLFYPSLMDDEGAETTSAGVYPEPIGSDAEILGNSNSLWEEEAIPNPNPFSED